MFRLIAGVLVLILATSAAVTYAAPLLGQPNYFIALLSAAVAVLALAVVLSARAAVSSRAFTVCAVVAACAIAVFGVGLRTSLVVDGRVVSYTSEQANISRQIDALQSSLSSLRAAQALLSASPSEQFARSGEAIKLADQCTAVLQTWDRTVPITPALTPALVAMKEGALACTQGTKMSSQSSATPDSSTTAAIAEYDTQVIAAIERVNAATNQAGTAAHLGQGPGAQ